MPEKKTNEKYMIKDNKAEENIETEYELDQSIVESVLLDLEQNNMLFSQFRLSKNNNKLVDLGSGTYSYVYEMYNCMRPDNKFAIKVSGLGKPAIDSDSFWNAGKLQWILCQEVNTVVRILDARELNVRLNKQGKVIIAEDATKKQWEEDGFCIRIQLVLMEKLERLLIKDQFHNVCLRKVDLQEESEVIKLALEIGLALSISHKNHVLHRDVKIENILWDDSQKIYKLGDFGIAKYVETGNAETLFLSKGYGAPEIERQLSENYNETADIYSLGITLYLLLNELKFPFSDGYYANVGMQYNAEKVFPAPKNASPAMAHVIRKMCSYHRKNRYQSMNQVLEDLVLISEENKKDRVQISDKIFEMVDLETETYHGGRDERRKKLFARDYNAENDDEKNNSDQYYEGIEDKEQDYDRPKTRAERKEEQKIINIILREYNIKFFLGLTLISVFLFKAMQPDEIVVNNSLLLILSIAVLFEALLQRIKEFHVFFGTIIIVLIGISIMQIGLTFPHIILLMSIFLGYPVLSAAGAIATAMWMIISMFPVFDFLNFLHNYDLGWILFAALLLVINGYFRMRICWNQETILRAFLEERVYDKIFLLMTISGFVLWILQKNGVLEIPDIVSRMHLFWTGITSFIGFIVTRTIEEHIEQRLEEQSLAKQKTEE